MTTLDKIINTLQNNRIVVLIIFVFIFITSLSTFTNAINYLITQLTCKDSSTIFYCRTNGLLSIKYHTGWINLGIVDNEETTYRTLPLYTIEKRVYDEPFLTPRIGELIKISANREIVILNYKTTDIKDVFIPPWKENILKDKDYTNFFITKDTIVEIRDVSIAGYPGHDKFVWARVGLPPN